MNLEEREEILRRLEKTAKGGAIKFFNDDGDKLVLWLRFHMHKKGYQLHTQKLSDGRRLRAWVERVKGAGR